MITRYRVWLDDKALDEIAESIYITDIQEMEPEQNVISMGLAGAPGSFLLSNHRLALQVLIRMQIREYDTAKRKEVLGKVLAWAQGEELVISDRPGLALHVQLDAVPAVSSLKWTETITLAFTAREIPYWQTEVPVYLLVDTAASSTYTFTVAGQLPSRFNGFLSNDGDAAIHTLSITIGEEELRLENLGLAAGDSLYFLHVGCSVLYILRVSTMQPVNGCLAEGSAWDLVIEPNAATEITITADEPVSAMLMAQGVWL